MKTAVLTLVGLWWLMQPVIGWTESRIAPPLEVLLQTHKPTQGADAEILLRKTRIDIPGSYLAKSQSYVAIAIGSEEGVRDYSQMEMGFNSFYETLTLDFARVRTPEGQWFNVEKDAIQLQNPAEENFYQDGKILTFSLPNVKVGSIIEFQYTREEIKKIIPNAWFETHWFNWWEERAANAGPRLDAVKEASLEIITPANMPLSLQASKALTATVNKKTENGKTYYSWQQKNTAAMELQANMPRTRDIFPVLQLSTLTSWQAVADWGTPLMAPHINTNAALEAAVGQIKTPQASALETIKNTYGYLQGHVRYVFAHVGRGGYEPHDATEVLKNGYGDCKDQTLLAVTLLRKQGIEAYPALVATRGLGMLKTDLPTVAFDHMITYIPAQKDAPEIWMDTSGEKSLFPGFSTAIEGQNALILKPNSRQLVQIPQRKTQDHSLHLKLVFDKVTPSSLEAQFYLNLSGRYEETFRSGWLFATEKQKMLRDHLGQLFAAAEISQLSTENAQSLWAPFTISGRYTFKNAWPGDNKSLTYAFNVQQLLAVFTDFNQWHKPEERKHPYAVETGLTLSADIEFLSPPGAYEAAVYTQGGNYKTPWFSLRQQGKNLGNKYTLSQIFTLPKQDISLQDYPSFFAAIKNLAAAPAWQVVFTPKNTPIEAPSSGTAVADLLTKAKQFLDAGEFKQALTLCEQAVALAPKNGEAFYVLGLSQGYLEQLDQAKKSFSRAKELGFNP